MDGNGMWTLGIQFAMLIKIKKYDRVQTKNTPHHIQSSQDHSFRMVFFFLLLPRNKIPYVTGLLQSQSY